MSVSKSSPIASLEAWKSRQSRVTGLLEKPVTLDWRDFQASRDAMGLDFETLIELLLQAQAETASAPDRVRFELKLDGQPS